MSKHRIAAKRDGNENELVQYLRQLGFVVARDLLVDLILVKDGKLVVAEVKNGKGRLTPTEQQFIADCAAQGVEIPVYRDLDDVLRDWNLVA